MHFSPEIEERLARLQEKYEAMGQDMVSYLDGLLHADFLTYWDYIHLDTLLSLQNPKTPFPDEEIFIIYHQITELYFKLALHECKQITAAKPLTAKFFAARLKRINNYFEALTQSFGIMVDGMEKEQFLKVPDVVTAGKRLPIRTVPDDRNICNRFYKPGCPG